MSGPQSGYKPCPKSPQFCCGCFLREWASHPWYILVKLRVSPSILELPKRPLRCPSQLSPPLRTVLRQSAKFYPFIPVRLASCFRVSSRRSPRAVRFSCRSSRFSPRLSQSVRTSGKTSERVTSNSKAHTLRCGEGWPTLFLSIHKGTVDSLEQFVDPPLCGPLRSSLTTTRKSLGYSANHESRCDCAKVHLALPVLLREATSRAAHSEKV